MLNTLRNQLKDKPYLKALLWIVCIGLVAYLGYYFTDMGGGPAGGTAQTWVAQVNDRSIPADLFLRTAQRQDREFRAIYGDQYETIRPQLQLGRMAVGQLINTEIMRQEAVKAGLGVSDEELRDRILEDPSLRDPASGEFIGMERYERIATREWGGVRRFEAWLRDQIVAGKWQDLVTATATVGADEVEELYRRRNVKTVVDYVVVPAGDMALDTEIDESELRAFHAENGDDYRLEPGRSIRYVLVDRDRMLDSVEVSEDDLRAYYDANAAAYTRPPERQARHILFGATSADDAETRERARREAEATLERVRSGEDFAALARTLSEDEVSGRNGGELGWFPRTGRMVEPFAAAAFALGEGEFAPVVETDFGYHVLQVTGVREGGLVPFDDVKEEIRNTVELERAQERAEAVAETLADAADGAAGLESAAAEAGLEVRTRVIRRGDARWDDLGVAPRLVERVFETEIGASTGAFGTGKGLVVAVVDSDVGPDVAPFEDVADRVRTDVLNRRLKDAALAEARRAYEAAGDLEGVAQRLGREIETSGDLAPGDRLEGAGELTAGMERAWFADSAAIGDTGVIEAESGAVVYRVTDRVPFDRAAFDAARPGLEAELVTQRKSLLIQQIMSDLLDEYRILTNDELIDSVGT